KECHGGIERALSLCEREWDLLGEARPDVVVGAHTEGVKAQRLLALAGHGNHDRGPLDLVRLAAARPPVGVEQDLEMRPGIDLVPAGTPNERHCHPAGAMRGRRPTGPADDPVAVAAERRVHQMKERDLVILALALAAFISIAFMVQRPPPLATPVSRAQVLQS